MKATLRCISRGANYLLIALISFGLNFGYIPQATAFSLNLNIEENLSPLNSIIGSNGEWGWWLQIEPPEEFPGITKTQTHPMVMRAIADSFSDSDPKLSENQWVGYLFPKASEKKNQIFYDMLSEIQGNPKDIVRGRDLKKKDNLIIVQHLLNQSVKYAPTLSNLLIQGKYDEAFKYAHQKGLMRYLLMPTGFGLLSVPKLSYQQMNDFYDAAENNWSIVRQYSHPYKGLKWRKDRALDKAAAKNSTRQGFTDYPNLAKFASKKKSQSFLKKYFVPIVITAAMAVATWGVGTAMSSAITTTTTSGAVTTTSVAGITTGTITTSMTATGLATTATTTAFGTAVGIGTNALAGAAIGTAMGGNFGDALKSGLVGGVVGAGLNAEIISQTGADNISISQSVRNSVSNVVTNPSASNIVSGLALGTASGAILNGGDFDAAFTGAVTGSVSNHLFVNPITRPYSEAESNRIVASHVEALQNQASVVSNENSASGSLNMAAAEQSSHTYDSSYETPGVNNAFARAANESGWASNVLSRDIATFDDSTGSYVQSYSTSDLHNFFVSSGGGAAGSLYGTTYGLGGLASSLGSMRGSALSSLPNLSDASLLPRQIWGMDGTVCVGHTCNLLDRITGGRANVPNPLDFPSPATSAALQNDFLERGAALGGDFFEGGSRLSASQVDDLIRNDTVPNRVYAVIMDSPAQGAHVVAAQRIGATPWYAGNYTSGIEGLPSTSSGASGLSSMASEQGYNPNRASYSLLAYDVDPSIGNAARTLANTGRWVTRVGSGLGGLALTAWDVVPLLPIAGDMAQMALPQAMNSYQTSLDLLVNNNSLLLNPYLTNAVNTQSNLVGQLNLIQQIGQSSYVAAANEIRTGIIDSFYSHPTTIAVSDAIFGLPGQISNAFGNGVRAILPTPRSQQLLNNLTQPPPPPRVNNGQSFDGISP